MHIIKSLYFPKCLHVHSFSFVSFCFFRYNTFALKWKCNHIFIISKKHNNFYFLIEPEFDNIQHFPKVLTWSWIKHQFMFFFEIQSFDIIFWETSQGNLNITIHIQIPYLTCHKILQILVHCLVTYCAVPCAVCVYEPRCGCNYHLLSFLHRASWFVQNTF